MEAEQEQNTGVPACSGCGQRDRRIMELEARVKQLEATMEQVRRSGKRQAAPFSRGVPKSDPRKPGRKSGDDYGTKAFRAIPPAIDEEHDAPLPGKCPRCGGSISSGTVQRIEHQYQAEIPRRPIYRRFNVAVGYCACCGKRVQGRHPLQTSDALGCCASQVGPEAQAAVVMLNKELGLSQGKIGRFFQAFFGIKLTRGGSCQIMLRAAKRCQPTYQALVSRTRQSPWIVPDETGWRIGGWSAWLHVAVTQETVVYLIARARGFAGSKLLMGEEYAGKLIHDGYAPYDRFWRATHQTCLGHLLRRCKQMLETATRGAVVFPRRIKAVLQEGLETRDRRDGEEITLRAAAARADALEAQVARLVRPVKTNAANETFAAHLQKHLDELFVFLRVPGIDATNWRAEQAIRPAVVNRKVWGGNRTETGAVAQSVLMSVLFTAIRQGRDVFDYLSQTLRAPPALLLTG